MKQLPGPGDTNMCPECRNLSCTCGPKPMTEADIPKYDLELAYAVERFEDEMDRKPGIQEMRELESQCREKVDAAKEAFADWKATGNFVCDYCEKIHHRFAPRGCRERDE